VVDVKIGKDVRLLNPNDPSCRRNRFRWSNLVTGTVMKEENGFFDVKVDETLSKTFVVMGKDGAELRLQGSQLKCAAKLLSELDPEDLSCPFRMKSYHAAVRNKVKDIRAGEVVKYFHDGVYVSAKVRRVVQIPEVRQMTYSVPKDRVIDQDTVFLSQRQIRKARRHNKLWGVGMTKPAATRVERAIVSATQVFLLSSLTYYDIITSHRSIILRHQSPYDVARISTQVHLRPIFRRDTESQ